VTEKALFSFLIASAANCFLLYHISEISVEVVTRIVINYGCLESKIYQAQAKQKSVLYITSVNRQCQLGGGGGVGNKKEKKKKSLYIVDV
jgi:hypothetical protein